MLLSPQNIADVLQRSPERLDRSGKAATLQSLPGSYRSYWADAHRLCMYLVAFAAAVLFFICDLVQKKHGELKAQSLLNRQGALRAEANQLTKQADRLCTPATFAQSTKLRRKAVAVEKESDELTAKQEAIKAGWAYRAPAYVKQALSLTLLVVLWGKPAARVDPNLLWPLTALLSRVGALGVVPFLAISRRASAALAGALLGAPAT